MQCSFVFSGLHRHKGNQVKYQFHDKAQVAVEDADGLLLVIFPSDFYTHQVLSEGSTCGRSQWFVRYYEACEYILDTFCNRIQVIYLP